jgi:hypothetical protein
MLNGITKPGHVANKQHNTPRPQQNKQPHGIKQYTKWERTQPLKTREIRPAKLFDAVPKQNTDPPRTTAH